MRMSQGQGQGQNDSKVRPTVIKEVLGHPPRNPLSQQIPQRQVPLAYQPPIEIKSKSRHEGQHLKSNKAKGRGRNSPVDTSFGTMPHGLTVQELKELTRIRLAREAMNNYSPETSDYSDTRTHTTTATFRSSYSGGDVDSYSDSGSVPRNRSTSTSPTSNTDSDSFEEGLTRFPPYHYPPIPISPSSSSPSINRSDRDRQIPSYSSENSIYMTPIQYTKSPHTTSPSVNSTPPSHPILHFPVNNQNHIPINNNNNSNNNNINVTQSKYVSGIHPGLHHHQQQLSQQNITTGSQQHHNLIRQSQPNIPDYSRSDVQISFEDIRTRGEPLSYHTIDHIPIPPAPILPTSSTVIGQEQRSTSLISNGYNLERETITPLNTNNIVVGNNGGNGGGNSGNSLRKLVSVKMMISILCHLSYFLYHTFFLSFF